MPNECIIRSGYDRNLINDRCEKSLQASSLSHNQNENIQLSEEKNARKMDQNSKTLFSSSSNQIYLIEFKKLLRNSLKLLLLQSNNVEIFSQTKDQAFNLWIKTIYTEQGNEWKKKPHTKMRREPRNLISQYMEMCRLISW